MASTISAIRNIFSDRSWIIKLGIFTGIYFFLRNQAHLWEPQLSDQMAFIFQIIFFVVLLGCACVSMHRNINNMEPFIPGPTSIIEVVIKSILSLIAIVPGALLTYAVYVFMINTFHFQELFVTVIVYVIAALIMSAFIFIPVILLSVRGNIIDAFRYDILFRGAGNYIVQIMGFALIYSLVVGITTIVLYNFLLEMLGDHPVLLLLQCFVIVFTFYTFFSFSSDLYGDGIPEINLKETYRPLKRTKSSTKKLKR